MSFHSYIITCNGGKMVVVSHLFSIFIINFNGGDDTYVSPPPTHWTIYFPTAPFLMNRKKYRTFPPYSHFYRWRKKYYCLLLNPKKKGDTLYREKILKRRNK